MRDSQRRHGVRGAQTGFRRNSSAPALGKVGLGATREASVSEEALSARTKKRLSQKTEKPLKREGAPRGKGRRNAPTSGGEEERGMRKEE